MVTKKRFSQAEWDRLVMRRAEAILALRKARQELKEYKKTHKSR
jgi:hypothetical protein